jgi:hypothetical protein
MSVRVRHNSVQVAQLKYGISHWESWWHAYTLYVYSVTYISRSCSLYTDTLGRRKKVMRETRVEWTEFTLLLIHVTYSCDVRNSIRNWGYTYNLCFLNARNPLYRFLLKEDRHRLYSKLQDSCESLMVSHWTCSISLSIYGGCLEV